MKHLIFAVTVLLLLGLSPLDVRANDCPFHRPGAPIGNSHIRSTQDRWLASRHHVPPIGSALWTGDLLSLSGAARADQLKLQNVANAHGAFGHENGVQDELIRVQYDSDYPYQRDDEDWSRGVDAVLNWGNGKAYLLSDDEYIRYDIVRDRADPDYPKPINRRTWPGVWHGSLDAAVNWGNGKAFLFRDDEYTRYDLAKDRADPGYPKPINSRTWSGVWRDGVDAAINWGNGKAYFFRGHEYIRYDIARDRADPGYPKAVNDSTWPGLGDLGPVDSAINWGNGKAYLFSGSRYVRYDIGADRADPGYPAKVNERTWPGLWALDSDR